MNKDELLNLVPLVVTLLAPLTAKYGLSAGDETSFLTGGIGIATGVWLHWNQKKVPETAVAIQPLLGDPAPSVGSGATVTGKVVG
jgi:hypothetical protein